MNINILSFDKKVLVNYNNVASISIKDMYKQYSTPGRWWEIVAYYPAVSSDIVYDVLGRYDDEKKCKKEFEKLINKIKSGDHYFITM